MKARIDYFCKPVKKGVDYELENIHMFVDIPFIPAIGTDLKVAKGGDYVAVEYVMLDLSELDEVPLNIALKEPTDELDLKTWKEMKALGWRLG